jgi:hypothetical protein
MPDDAPVTIANFREVPLLVLMILSFQFDYGFEGLGVLLLPEPPPLLPLLWVFPRRLLVSELVPPLPEPGLADPGAPCAPVFGAPVEPVPGVPDPGVPVPGEPLPEPVPDPEPLPAPWAKTNEAGVATANSIASAIFFMRSCPFVPVTTTGASFAMLLPSPRT